MALCRTARGDFCSRDDSACYCVLRSFRFAPSPPVVHSDHERAVHRLPPRSFLEYSDHTTISKVPRYVLLLTFLGAGPVRTLVRG
eukprot:1692792-Prymnesium_polylepis.1